jgi:hypothetical protein
VSQTSRSSRGFSSVLQLVEDDTAALRFMGEIAPRSA